MKLSELLQVRDALSNIDFSKIAAAAELEYEKLCAIGNDIAANTRTATTHLIRSIDDAIYLHDKSKDALGDMILGKQSDYFAMNDAIYKSFLDGGVSGSRTYNELERITTAIQEVILGRIGAHIDWRYPGLEIGPGDGSWTKHLVGLDPLYLIDIHQEFLDSAASQFPARYQEKLKRYRIDSLNDFDSFFPNNYFSFVFAWGVFNFFPLDKIEEYIAALRPYLKHGATVMFSYNNGERWNCAARTEMNWMTHIPKYALVPKMEQLGYRVDKTFDEGSAISWIELVYDH